MANDIGHFYTYLHCKPDGSPFYVGKGIVSKQPRSHNFNNRSKYHKNVVKKYGKENIQIIVFKKDSEESAFKSEIRLIKILRNAGFELCNHTNGGEGTVGLKPTPEKSMKVRLKLFGKKRPKEVGEKISKSKKGLIISDETKRNMSLAGILRTSKGIPKGTREKLSISAKKQWSDPDIRNKMIIAQKNRWAKWRINQNG